MGRRHERLIPPTRPLQRPKVFAAEAGDRSGRAAGSTTAPAAPGTTTKTDPPPIAQTARSRERPLAPASAFRTGRAHRRSAPTWSPPPSRPRRRAAGGGKRSTRRHPGRRLQSAPGSNMPAADSNSAQHGAASRQLLVQRRAPELLAKPTGRHEFTPICAAPTPPMTPILIDRPSVTPRPTPAST